MKILVTAGPTREAIDPVRFLSNRSSGRMGYAVAQAALERGHEVVLISGPVSIPAPACARLVPVISAADMQAALDSHLEWCDALVMCAAVADWRPKTQSGVKLKKAEMPPVIELEPNPDILNTLHPLKEGRPFVGFAAETGDPLAEAQRKLTGKGLDLIVANDVSRPDAGFEVDTNLVTLLTTSEPPRALPLQSKLDVGRAIVAWIEQCVSVP